MNVPAEPEPNLPPRPRIGDAERDQAISYLQEHMAQGRLDRAEFDERLNQALRARTDADLQPLFDDLPEPRPASAGPAVPAYAPPPWAGATAVPPPVPVPGPPSAPVPQAVTPRWVSVTLAAVWPVAVVFFVATGFNNWWIFVAAAIATYFLRQGVAHDQAGGPDEPPRSLQR